MKYLILCLLVIGCVDKEGVLGEYPGNKTDHYKCRMLWELGWRIDVKKCHEELTNPKFKIGQIVDVNDNKYSSECVAVVVDVGGFSYASQRNEVIYYVNIKCESVEVLRELYYESDLKVR